MYATILTKAAELVERGWCQGAYARDKYGVNVSCHDDRYAEAYCMMGAIAAAADSRDLGLGAARAVINAIQPDIDEHDVEDAITAWNDEEGRTSTEVATKLREAAKGPQ